MPEPHLSVSAQRFEYRRAERNKRAAAVTRVIEQHKFDERYQVPEAMEPNCDVCVIVPAYDEHVRVLSLLVSMADQEDIRPDQFEVIVVVNNTADEAQQESPAFISNQVTLHVLRSLQQKQMPLLYDNANVPLGPSDERYDWLKKAVDKIVAAKLRIHLIDLSSPGQSQETNNVGIARDVGGWEAVRRFHANGHLDGLIMNTDADCRFESTTLADTRQAFWSSHVDHVGGSGGREAEHDYPTVVELEARLLQQINRQFNRLLSNIAAYRHPTEPRHVSPANYFGGANIVSRMDTYALSGGIPHIAGGEDTFFGMRLAKLGHVAFLPTSVRTQFRGSQRTDPAHGYGWNVARAQERRTQDNPTVESLAYRLAVRACTSAIEDQQPFSVFAQAQPELGQYIGQTLYDQMLALYPQTIAADRYPEAAHAYNRLERLELRQALAPHFPDEPVEVFVDHVVDYVGTELADHRSELTTLYNEALTGEVIIEKFKALFRGVETLYDSLGDDDKALLRDPMTSATAAQLAPKVLEFWQANAAKFQQDLADVLFVYEKGLETFVKGFLYRPWLALEEHHHDLSATLLYYALYIQDPDLLPDSLIRSQTDRLQALCASVEQLAASLR